MRSRIGIRGAVLAWHPHSPWKIPEGRTPQRFPVLGIFVFSEIQLWRFPGVSKSFMERAFTDPFKPPHEPRLQGLGLAA